MRRLRCPESQIEKDRRQPTGAWRRKREASRKGMARELGERNCLLVSNFYVPGVVQVQF